MLIFLSFCDFAFIKDNFLFLKTTVGRGFFDLFCACLFLMTGTLMNYIMCGCLGVCGVFFIVMGAILKKDIAGGDFKQSDLKASAASSAFENRSLLS